MMTRMMQMMTRTTKLKTRMTVGRSNTTWPQSMIQAGKMFEEVVKAARKTKKEELVAVHWSVLLSSSGVVK